MLDRWRLWKAVRGTPDRLNALERRVAELEEKLGDTWPPDVCRACGERALRLYSTLGPNDEGHMMENWNCSECHARERRQVKAR